MNYKYTANTTITRSVSSGIHTTGIDMKEHLDVIQMHGATEHLARALRDKVLALLNAEDNRLMLAFLDDLNDVCSKHGECVDHYRGVRSVTLYGGGTVTLTMPCL